jgi:hypothetical protein
MFHYSRPRPYVHILHLRASRTVRRAFTGAALILLGLGFLLRNQGLIGTTDLWLIAPALIGLSGLMRLVAAPNTVNFVRAVLRLGLAAYLVVVIEHIGGWTFVSTWPVLLIAVGGSMLGYEWLVGRRSREDNW